MSTHETKQLLSMLPIEMILSC